MKHLQLSYILNTTKYTLTNNYIYILELYIFMFLFKYHININVREHKTVLANTN